MIGAALKEYIEKLPENEKIAIKALCEPDWNCEVLGLKKGSRGVMILPGFYQSPVEMAYVFDGELKQVFDEEDMGEDVFREYEDLRVLHEEEMKPYPWRIKVLTQGNAWDAINYLHDWLFEHDPDVVDLTHDVWLERDQVLRDLKKFDEIVGYEDLLYEEEIKKGEP